MTDSLITIHAADTDDLDHVEALLEANGLPYQDVRTKPECFFIAHVGKQQSHVGNTSVGAGGLEIYGSKGLLRSVVVEESMRGQGYGEALCDELEAYARNNGVEMLYLLTTTAAAFFHRRGYDEIPRKDAPASIQGTTEFTKLCPDSATCMEKDLR